MRPRRRGEVFVTAFGRRYHDPARHLMTGSGAVHVTVAWAERQGYEPCSRCFGTPPARPAVGRNPSRAYLAAHRDLRGEER